MSLTELQMAAALAEQVYRRNSVDQQLPDDKIDGIAGVSGLQATNVTGGGDAFYYDDTTGFAARVVVSNGTAYVVFRGTDMAGGFGALAAAEVGFSPSSAIDIRDFTYGNFALGTGTSSRSQFDDALALGRATRGLRRFEF